MDQDLAKGPIGNVGSYDVSFKGGKLLVSADVSLPPAESAKLVIEVDAGKVLSAIENAIPGKLDDFAIGLIKTALGI